MAGLYKTITSTDVDKSAQPGYFKAWYSPLGDFTTLQVPSLSTPPAIGEKYTIATSHVWANGKSPIGLYIADSTAENDGDSLGDIECGRFHWKFKVMLLGDTPEIQEIMENMLNDRGVFFLQPNMVADTFIQLGNVISPGILDKGGFKSGNLKSGGKKWEINAQTFARNFYTGTVPTR